MAICKLNPTQKKNTNNPKKLNSVIYSVKDSFIFTNDLLSPPLKLSSVLIALLLASTQTINSS